jgi:hypothetical protein
VASTGAATAAMPFVFVNNSQLRFYWPNTSLSPAAYSVQVSNPPASGNLSATLAGAFTVSAPQPTITNLSPDSKTYGVSASSQITVFGSNFIVGAQVTIGSLSGTTVAGSSATATVPFVHASAGQIKFWWPNTSLAPGLYAIQVTNPASAGAESGTLAAAFTVVPPQPTVTSASPTPLAYAVDVSRSVTVFGTNFINGATISVGSLSGATVAGSIATATVPFVYVSSSQPVLVAQHSVDTRFVRDHGEQSGGRGRVVGDVGRRLRGHCACAVGHLSHPDAGRFWLNEPVDSGFRSELRGRGDHHGWEFVGNDRDRVRRHGDGSIRVGEQFQPEVLVAEHLAASWTV